MNRLSLPDGGSIAWRDAGQGAPLLLIRPLGGSSSLWGAFHDALAARFRVISYDLRGSGGSSPPKTSVTTRALADDARALLDHVGVDRAHVFGISLGGMIATWLAVDRASRVDRLVLASTLPRGLTARHASLSRGLSLARCLALRGPECEACLARRVLSKKFLREHPDDAARIARQARAEPARRSSLFVLLAAAARHDARAVLDRITAPTLVLAGLRDHLALARHQRGLAARIPHATFATVDAGHDLTLERPRETAERVVAFLS